jgi:hypothetical protein
MNKLLQDRIAPETGEAQGLGKSSDMTGQAINVTGGQGMH